MFGVRHLACEHEPERYAAPGTELPSLADLAFELSARCGLRRSQLEEEPSRLGNTNDASGTAVPHPNWLHSERRANSQE